MYLNRISHKRILKKITISDLYPKMPVIINNVGGQYISHDDYNIYIHDIFGNTIETPVSSEIYTEETVCIDTKLTEWFVVHTDKTIQKVLGKRYHNTLVYIFDEQEYEVSGVILLFFTTDPKNLFDTDVNVLKEKYTNCLKEIHTKLITNTKEIVDRMNRVMDAECT